jgi:PIN domain nuclease of toxin-antitoxin system
MRLLLDTHALLWLLNGSARLGGPARGSISDPRATVLVSVVSLWEIAIKVRLGKLPPQAANAPDAVAQGDFMRLPITDAHLRTLGTLRAAPDHGDPFDHLLIAQAIVETALFVTEDRYARNYPVAVVPCS